jgi:hypothetical protein
VINSPGYASSDKHHFVAPVAKGARHNEQIFAIRILQQCLRHYLPVAPSLGYCKACLGGPLDAAVHL